MKELPLIVKRLSTGCVLADVQVPASAELPIWRLILVGGLQAAHSRALERWELLAETRLAVRGEKTGSVLDDVARSTSAELHRLEYIFARLGEAASRYLGASSSTLSDQVRTVLNATEPGDLRSRSVCFLFLGSIRECRHAARDMLQLAHFCGVHEAAHVLRMNSEVHKAVEQALAEIADLH